MERVKVFRALGDRRRMELLTLLLGHGYCVRALARKLELSEATVSQHLKVLREAGLLSSRRNGYFVHYEVDRAALRAAARELELMAEAEHRPCGPEKECGDHGHCHGQRPEKDLR